MNYQLTIFCLTVLALLAAWMMEYVFGIRPCQLCLYQRYIILAIIVFTGSTAFVSYKKWHYPVTISLILAGLGMTSYQVAVEQHLVALPKVCEPPETQNAFESIEAMREAILGTAYAPCDEVTFSVLGLSLATYMIFFYIFLLLLFFFRKRPQ
ncbi:MAG: disulfide bond formation protein B [Alphaproteobacteria bacterium]